LGQFFDILKYVCSITDTYFKKVDKNYTSQICPNCGTHTGKKELNVRVHSCPECGYSRDRDVAAAEVIRNRGLDNTAVGAPVIKQPSNKERISEVSSDMPLRSVAF
ncbi:MAG: zinc ribbon domain-containing protein, partial [Xenococcaceae cyanobacterium]